MGGGGGDSDVGCFRKRDEVFAFDERARADERELAEIFRERRGRVAVSTVYGTYRGERFKWHIPAHETALFLQAAFGLTNN